MLTNKNPNFFTSEVCPTPSPSGPTQEPAHSCPWHSFPLVLSCDTRSPPLDTGLITMIIYCFSQFSESEVQAGLSCVVLLFHVVLLHQLAAFTDHGIELEGPSWLHSGWAPQCLSFLWWFFVSGPAQAAVQVGGKVPQRREKRSY